MSLSETWIPFNRASFPGAELNFVGEAIELGHISGNGKFTKESETLLSKICGSPATLLTTSCTHALELASRILRLGPGDEVIVPAYTFVSTASAFAMSGAVPVFVDVDERTLNLDVHLVEDAITPRTRAICTVHYAGIANNIDALEQLCRMRGIPLIEDNAHGLGASYQGRKLGTFGQLSTMSFHETKNITCGEGGALGINDLALLELGEILREKGTDRTQFLRGQVDKYTWREVGSSWVMSDILAALLFAQLQNFASIQGSRMAIWLTYQRSLFKWSRENSIIAPFVPEHAQHPAHMYFLRLPDLDARTRFIEHMSKHGISTVFHYQALNTSQVGSIFGGRVGDCPVSELAAETLVRLPLYSSLGSDDLDRIIDSVLEFRV